MSAMGRGGRLWYLKPTSRELLDKLIKAQGGTRKVAKESRLGISHVGLHRIAAGEVRGSWVIPELLRYFNLDPRDHIDLELDEELTDEQLRWLKLLADLREAGKDPVKVETTLRGLLELPGEPRK